jgi:hypothetical protein
MPQYRVLRPVRIGAATILALALAAAGVSGQRAAPAARRWFPRVPLFPAAVADPTEPRFAGALMHTDILGQRPREREPFLLDPTAASGGEVQAVVSLGGTYPIVQWPVGSGWMGIGGQVGSVTRFRIERLSRDEFSSDWMVALPIEVASEKWAGRFRIIHRSSHLGDEFLQNNEARRIELGGDGLDLYVARRVGGLYGYAGAEWIFYSETEPLLVDFGRGDNAMLQAGVAGEWPLGAATSRWSVVAAGDWQSWRRTEWGSTLSGLAGARLRAGARYAQLALRATRGPSAVGEFFRTPETLWGLELTVNP